MIKFKVEILDEIREEISKNEAALRPEDDIYEEVYCLAQHIKKDKMFETLNTADFVVKNDFEKHGSSEIYGELESQEIYEELDHPTSIQASIQSSTRGSIQSPEPSANGSDHIYSSILRNRNRTKCTFEYSVISCVMLFR